MDRLDLLAPYKKVRQRSLGICESLSVEDQTIQSMPDASPAKWHLAHTTWFFETFALLALGERPHDQRWSYLFNSYYEGVGPHLERSRRGTISRPGLDEVHAYRAEIDERVARVLERDLIDDEIQRVVELGLHHEQQHQELLLTDIKHALATQPMQPAYRTDLLRAPSSTIAPLEWIELPGGIDEIGARDPGFAFDNERPRHRVLLAPFAIASRPIANVEVLDFISDGGYREPRWWLADGFAQVQREGWCAPLYWVNRDGVWLHYELAGAREVDPAETACHLSYYEADAIARWAGARLPTELEWERATRGLRDRDGHWADDDRLHPRAVTQRGLAQVFGDVWEWTRSAYAPYPGFAPLAGALGEYNGKFMSGQMVMRGGSCLTPRGHVRASYRNYFAPATRWQMTGARFASDRGLP